MSCAGEAPIRTRDAMGIEVRSEMNRNRASTGRKKQKKPEGEMEAPDVFLSPFYSVAVLPFFRGTEGVLM